MRKKSWVRAWKTFTRISLTRLIQMQFLSNCCLSTYTTVLQFNTADEQLIKYIFQSLSSFPSLRKTVFSFDKGKNWELQNCSSNSVTNFPEIFSEDEQLIKLIFKHSNRFIKAYPSFVLGENLFFILIKSHVSHFFKVKL